MSTILPAFLGQKKERKKKVKYSTAFLGQQKKKKERSLVFWSLLRQKKPCASAHIYENNMVGR
jgi:hypothetical protein